MSSKRIPKKPEQRRAWIIYQFKLRGSSFSKLARENGVTRQAPWMVFVYPSPKWEEIIAKKIERTPAEIWPERYAA